MRADGIRHGGSERVLGSVVVCLLLAGLVGATQLGPEPGPRSLTQVRAGDGALPSDPREAAPLTPETSPDPLLPRWVDAPTVERATAVVQAVPPGPDPATLRPADTGVPPPAPGSYPYRSGNADAASTEPRGFILVEPVREGPGETYQAQTDTASVYGTPRGEYVWRGDGVYLHAVGDIEGTACDFNPDVLLYPWPLTVGHEWDIDSTCTYPDGGQPVTERVQGRSRISGSQRIVIGGQEVEVFTVESSQTLTSEAAGDRRIESTRTDLFAPSVGLTVRSEKHFRHLRGDELMGEEWEGYELLTLRPR